MVLDNDWRARSRTIQTHLHNLHEMPHCALDTQQSHAMASALSSQDHDQSSSDTEQTEISVRQ